MKHTRPSSSNTTFVFTFSCFFRTFFAAANLLSNFTFDGCWTETESIHIHSSLQLGSHSSAVIDLSFVHKNVHMFEYNSLTRQKNNWQLNTDIKVPEIFKNLISRKKHITEPLSRQPENSNWHHLWHSILWPFELTLSTLNASLVK